MQVPAACLVEPGKIETRNKKLEMTHDSLLVRIVGNGVCGTDVSYFAGHVPGLKYPRFFGHESVGIVEEVGKNVEGFASGDLVTGGWGAYSSHVVVSKLQYTMQIPDHGSLSPEYIMGDPLQCIATIIRAAKPEFGDSVAVVGCGFMGLMCISALAGRLVQSLFAIDLIEERLGRAAESGAVKTLNPVTDDVRDAILEATEGKGVDICIEASGNASAVDLAARILKKGRGRLVLGGFHPKPASYDFLPWAIKGLEVINAHPNFSCDLMEDMRRGVIAQLEGVFPTEKLVTHRFTIEQTQDVFEAASERSTDYIKGVMVPETA
ncbi:zinc-binding dehydrogenase [Candidatus Hydrogenedentota bacterium]